MSEDKYTTSRLSELANNQEATIVKVLGHGAFRKRITEMGFVAGTNIKVIKQAPLKGPIEYELLGYHVSLRHSEAELIEVDRRRLVFAVKCFEDTTLVGEGFHERFVVESEKFMSKFQ